MKVFVGLALLTVAFTQAACQDGGAPSGSSRDKIASKKDSLSYFFGTSIGNSMRKDSLDMNAEMIYAGVRDALKGDTAVLADSGYARLVQAFSMEMQTKAMARQEQQMKDQRMKDSVAGIKNKTEGEAFLAQNKTKPDVVTLPSGLQYRVIKEGTGPMPKATDNVNVLYRGTLTDGTPFDSSGAEPASFNIGQVVPGFSEALTKMKVGSKWQVFIPPALGYGTQTQPGSLIGPNAVLVFDLELVGIGQPSKSPTSIELPGGHP
jgi:FKBP-type peptidyl-prolyl cis-trans isomerase